MKKAVFITVRSDSSRLPNKAFLPIIDKPLIEMVIIRAKLVRNVDEVIVCTTERQIDDKIVEIANKYGVKHFRGNLDDKLERWLGAAKKFNIDYFVTMDGDDPFCDPGLMEAGIDQIIDGNYDYLKAPEGLIIGGFTYCIKVSALQKVCEIKGTADTEMMWTYFEDTGLFNVSTLKVNDKVLFNESIRSTLDYEEDLKFFRTVFEHFNCTNNDVPLKKIAEYLDQNPEIIEINSFRRAEWANNQKKKTKLVIKKS